MLTFSLLSESTMCTASALKVWGIKHENWNMENRQLVWGDQRKQKLSNFWSMSFQLGSSQNLCLSHKFRCANFFALILEQCSWVGQVLLCTRERENLAAFQGFGSRTRRVFRAIPTWICILPKMFDNVHSHENHWEKKTAWILTLEKKRSWVYFPLNICMFVQTPVCEPKTKFGKTAQRNIFCMLAVVVKICWGLACPTKDIWLNP